MTLAARPRLRRRHAGAKWMSAEQNTDNGTMTLSHTDRGFSILHFADRYGVNCSLQKSSLATEDAIWFGCSDASPQIMASQAAEHGVETDQVTGWVPYPIPEAVSLNTRMHLTQEQVRELLPYLQHFAETGEISGAPADHECSSEQDGRDDQVMELRLCEQQHVVLQPDRLYRFTADTDCHACQDMVAFNSPAQNLPMQDSQERALKVLTYREVVAKQLDAGTANAETQRHAAHMLRERTEQHEPVSAFDPSELEDMARTAFEEAMAFGISTDSFLRLAKWVATAIPVGNELAVAGWETVFPSPELAAKYGTTVVVQKGRPTPPYSSTQPLCRIADAVRMLAQRDAEIRELSATAEQNWAYVQLVDNYMAQHGLLELVHEDGGGREAGLNVVAGIEKLRMQCVSKGTPEA